MSAPPYYHLTPATLVGERFAPDVFGDIRIAIVGYAPPPSALERYHPVTVNDQHFIHVPPSSVRILQHGGRRFLSLAHVYGGPVSASTVEELAYYGMTHILAYGLAAGLGTKGLVMGDFYLVEDALAADGTTPHYSDKPLIAAAPDLSDQMRSLWRDTARPALTPVRAATGDAIYRESAPKLDIFRAAGCDIVNLDSAHLYAVSTSNSAERTVKTIQCGVLSDIVGPGLEAGSQSTLSAMLAATPDGAINPLERTGDIVRFYIETLAPKL